MSGRCHIHFRKDMTIKAVIFDIDGTLIDSVDAHARSWQRVFKKYGHDVSFEAVRQQIGKGADQLLPVFLSPEEIEKFGKQMEKERGELFKREYLPHIKPFPKVRELFKRILADRKQVALASSAKGDELESYERIARIEDLVQKEADKDDAAQSKPAPDIFQAALDKLKIVKPSEALVVGDTPYDAEAAAKAGIKTIGVLCGGHSAEELCAAGCIVIYRDPADLLAHYDKSPIVAPTADAARR
jgi:HAD superfamily hydrolase (TIGR01509 family)